MATERMGSFIAVVGGGPAGLLAAQHLAEAGHQVVVYDAQPTVGRKFLVAGHGGFNLTNAEPLPDFEQRYGSRQASFQRYLRHFSPHDLRHWLHTLGIETFVGTSGRIFPTAAHKPAQVLRAWLSRLEALGVGIRVRHRWLGFTPDNGLRLRDDATGQELVVHPQATILALGGSSWTKTGSDGQWTTALTTSGVRCVPFEPANCGAEVTWSAFFRDKVGRVPLKNIALTCGLHTVRGELMLTDYGLEGTPVYALTPALRAALATEAPAVLLLNLKPDLSAAHLLEKLRQPRNGKSLAVYLDKTLRLGAPVPTLLRELGPATAGDSPGTLAALLQRLPIPVRGLRPLDEAISTAGGVAWDELDENLMLARRPGVFVAGEMLDWEAPTGGYLLQGCLSTGAWAAHGAHQWLAR
ncbi:BaiN/RdsA family NAD(P)/FAD-dependent oxidoreductase [Hymenobacter elongatus]|uniref:TIGR03862 family flavoprotein n=1 Tax=Hymenobacter elongatus TaxID=877208 RepID=A0A4Z0PKY8_9BACT|nr:TIGR03862 family flavoprotein [Hymenobacter elongatus]TGE16422.1 TIGR03862 family flavoprotein [Hymenobacter elongatus]